MSSLTCIPERKQKITARPSKSMESLYSNTSSKYAPTKINKKRNVPAPLPKPSASTNEIRQRVLSARRLRMKSVQNQLSEANLQIAELAQENRILRSLHKRQDNALAKYENTRAELPKLLHRQDEEIRVCEAKFQNIQEQNKNLLLKIKKKDATILNLTDQNQHLVQLNNDKHLDDRDRLTQKVNNLQNKLDEKEKEINFLTKRLQIESKTYKKTLITEQKRYKDVMVRLEKARSDMNEFPKLDTSELTEKLTNDLNKSIGKTNTIKNPNSKITRNNNVETKSSTSILSKPKTKLSTRITKPNLSKFNDRKKNNIDLFSETDIQEGDKLTDAIKNGILPFATNNKIKNDNVDDSFDDDDDLDIDDTSTDVIDSSASPRKNKGFENSLVNEKVVKFKKNNDTSSNNFSRHLTYEDLDEQYLGKDLKCRNKFLPTLAETDDDESKESI